MMKKYRKANQKIMKYFEKHPTYNSAVHVVSGVGLGIMITYPFVGEHPVRWALAFVILGFVGHLYALTV